MNLLSPFLLPDTLKNNNLLIDTTSLINASRSDDFLKLLVEISSAKCALMTIPSVVYEFTRGAQSIEQLDQQLEFIKDLGITVLTRLEDKLSAKDHRVFMMAYNKNTSGRGDKGASYTDSLLCAAAYLYRNSNLRILTANHKDIPSALFDREHFITFEVGGEIRTEAIYKFSDKKLASQLKKLS